MVKSTALLAGDVLLIKTYEALNRIDKTCCIAFYRSSMKQLPRCVRQQLDMDFKENGYLLTMSI